MASKFKKKGGIKETQDGNFGNYKEYNGGGSPKGGGWGGQDGRVGWQKRVNNGEVKSGEHRQDQPRTDDGKFTYNSVNGKETKYESRGETVNPLLTGGKNGVKIEEVEKQFKAKSGNYWNEYKNKWHQRGSKMITKLDGKLKTVISQENVWDIARVSFDVAKGAFTGEDENWQKTKTGARSAEEKAARKEAYTNQEETFVSDTKSGGIAQHDKTAADSRPRPSTGIPFSVPFMKLAANRAAKNFVAPTTTISSSQLKQSVATLLQTAQQATPIANRPGPVAPAQAPLKHTSKEIGALRQKLIAKGADPAKVNKMPDSVLDANWDRLIK